MNLLSQPIIIFIEIVEAGSITRASENLELGKSSVSDSLKQLEFELGTRLLTRTTRRQSLTPAGDEFYERCKRLALEGDDVLLRMSEKLLDPEGTLRITAPFAMIDRFIAPAIATLMQQHKKIRPDIVISDERLDLIKEKIDIALSIGKLVDSEYKAQRIMSIQDLLCVTPKLLNQYSMKGNDINCFSKVKKLPHIRQLWEGSNLRKGHIFTDKNGKSHSVIFNHSITTNSVSSAKALLLESVGIAYMPSFLVSDMLEKGELVRLLP